MTLVKTRMDGILLGGLAGGAMEVVAVTLYALLAGAGGWVVAEEVSKATFGTLFVGTDAVLVGLAVHFGLSFLIAACFLPFVPALLRRGGPTAVVAVAAAVLVTVWGFNFMVLLPAIAPGFVHLVPLWVSFLSKLAFGVAMGVVLVSGSRRRTPA